MLEDAETSPRGGSSSSSSSSSTRKRQSSSASNDGRDENGRRTRQNYEDTDDDDDPSPRSISDGRRTAEASRVLAIPGRLDGISYLGKGVSRPLVPVALGE